MLRELIHKQDVKSLKLDLSSVGPEPDITLIFTLNLNLISGNQVQGRFSKIRLFPDIRVMPDIRVLT